MLGQDDGATGYWVMALLLSIIAIVVPALFVMRVFRQRKRKRSREAMLSTDDLRRKRLAKLDSTKETKVY